MRTVWTMGELTVLFIEHGEARHSPVARGRGQRALEELAAILIGRPTSVKRRCPTCGSTDHGRPVCADAGVLLSVGYADGALVAAAARSGSVTALGVDIEAGEPTRDALPGRSLRDWVRIEAAVKADGRGLLLDTDEVAITGDSILLPGVSPFVVVDVSGAAGYTISAAYRPRPT